MVGASWDTTPCRMTGVTLHSHVRYEEKLLGVVHILAEGKVVERAVALVPD